VLRDEVAAIRYFAPKRKRAGKAGPSGNL